MNNIYLTIDDVPTADFKHKMQYLKSESIPATVFCIGQNVAQYEADLIVAIKNGTVVGSHSYTHSKFSQLSVAQMEDEISKTDSIINDLYARAKQKRTKKIFRFPYGDGGGKQAPEAQQLLKKYGYELPDLSDVTYPFYTQHVQAGAVDVPWTFNVMEYQFKSQSDIKKRMDARQWPLGVDIPQNGGYLTSDSAEVIIIHDHDGTGEMFQSIVQNLQAKNVVFKSI